MVGAESISVLMTCSCPSIVAVVVDSVPSSSSESFLSCATASELMVGPGAAAGASRRIAGVMALTSPGTVEAEDMVIINAGDVKFESSSISQGFSVLSARCCNVSVCIC